jgi:uncharacterized membrane protein YfcA
MGLLSIVMLPAQAAPLMIIPALATNIWQMAAGPALLALLRRYATMIIAIFVGTFSTIGLMTKTAAFAGVALGAVLAAYGAYGLWGRRFQVERGTERWLGPLIGFVSGLISGATGVFVIPNVPYLTSLKMDSEELVQSIGIIAFVCPLAIGLALAVHGQYRAEAAGTSFVALFPALAGMWLGIRVRRRMRAEVFMKWFFAALIALGAYMAARSLRLV